MDLDKLIIFDTETTGFNPCHIIEIAFVHAMTGKVLLDTRVKNLSPITESAQKIHGIKESDLIDSPNHGIIVNFLEQHEDCYFTSFNTNFDFKAIRETTEREIRKPAKCIMKAAAKKYNKGERISLAETLDRMNIKMEGKAHNALSDTLATQKVFLNLLKTGHY